MTRILQKFLTAKARQKAIHIVDYGTELRVSIFIQRSCSCQTTAARVRLLSLVTQNFLVLSHYADRSEQKREGTKLHFRPTLIHQLI